MPCTSDCCEPSEQHKELQKVAKLLVYVFSQLEYDIPDPIKTASLTEYGDRTKLDEYTELLCATCKNMSEGQKSSIIYNARSALSRQLADWWEYHQEVDRRREEEENNKRQQAALLASARSKVTKEEWAAILNHYR